MFDHKHHNATGFERVKYGTMNFTNDPTGVKVCAGYVQSQIWIHQAQAQLLEPSDLFFIC